MPTIVSRRRVAVAVGIAAAALLALIQAIGYSHTAGEEGGLWAVPLISLGTGVLLVLTIDRKRDVWAFCLALGTVIGLYSAGDLYSGPAMEMEYEVGLLTNAVFIVLGFLLGAFSEIVYALHNLTHLLADFQAKGGLPPREPPKD